MWSTYNSATGWAVITLFCGTGRAWWEGVKGGCRRAFFSVCLTEAERLLHHVHWGMPGMQCCLCARHFLCVWSLLGFLRFSCRRWSSAGCMWISCVCVRQVPDQCRKQHGRRHWPHQLSANASQCSSAEEKQSWMIPQRRGVFPIKKKNERKISKRNLITTLSSK